MDFKLDRRFTGLLILSCQPLDCSNFYPKRPAPTPVLFFLPKKTASCDFCFYSENLALFILSLSSIYKPGFPFFQTAESLVDMDPVSGDLNSPHSMGTTIIGVTYNGGVVLGADSRTSTGTILYIFLVWNPQNNLAGGRSYLFLGFDAVCLVYLLFRDVCS